MESKNFVKAGILTLILVIISIGSWEFYLRNKGITIAYDDGKELWSDKRAKVYAPSDEATVFIGSSRNKYDLDTDTWRSLTGEEPIQLAFEGASPLPILDDLANDQKFKGKLMIDVTEGLFFSLFSPLGARVTDGIKYFKDRTPAQNFSFKVNHILESQLVFLDKDYLSLNALLSKVVPPRPGVYPDPDFPMEFGRITFDRQDKMTDRFVADTNLQNKVKGIWGSFAKLASTIPPPTPAQIDSIFTTVKNDINKIKARGGQIIFVRTPSSGPYLMGEKMVFPREKYWDKLLALTNCPGIHFEDYPAIAHFQCPEFSHLSPSDAIVFTKNLIKILEEEKGWRFPNKQLTAIN
ncbi:MAG TPA: hypothetical protein VMY77_04960 [Chitinophagaceae bacterium]|nr:hypothetical protein [Chitinophagaceae bacterium]